MFKTMSQNSMYQGLLSINNLFNLGPAFILALLHNNIHPIDLPQGAGAGLPDQPEAIPSCALECLSTRVDLFRWKPGLSGEAQDPNKPFLVSQVDELQI